MATDLKGLFRGDHICMVCRLHTNQKLTKHGWVCLECNTAQSKEEENQNVKLTKNSA